MNIKKNCNIFYYNSYNKKYGKNGDGNIEIL